MQRQRGNVLANDDNSHSVVADQFSKKVRVRNSVIQSLKVKCKHPRATSRLGAFPAFRQGFRHLRHSQYYHSISCQRFILIGFNVACVQIQNRPFHLATLRGFHSCSRRGL